jgi:ubiquinone/menaquinone biosynthesis C-methylase UbiE
LTNDATLHFYTTVASEYAEKYFHEFDHKPFDCSVLERFAERVKPLGHVCDVGCGPGEVACFLKARGVDVFGLDFCPAMLKQARRLNPDIEFIQGDMFRLLLPEGSLAGITAFYAIVHLTLDQAEAVLREFHRALTEGGLLLLAFHIGNETIRVTEAFGKTVDVDFSYFETDAVLKLLADNGFAVEETLIRYPYADIEYPSRRAYITARKTAQDPRRPGPEDKPGA